MTKAKLKNILFYSILFLGVLLLCLITHLNTDEIWAYGFAHSIYKGLIPYADFNMVITPFFPLIISLPFHVFSSSIFVYIIANLIYVFISLYLLKELIGDKAYILFAIMIAYFIYALNYNTFSVFLFILIVYLEKKKKSDYLIGLVLSILLLTKQSIGILMLLPSLYYIKDIKKLGKRFIAFIIPSIIFIIYLICTNTFNSFFDLCFFGLLDFASSNGGFNIIKILIFIIIILITIVFIIKHKKDITGYYALTFFIGMSFPILDNTHTFMGLIAIFLYILMHIEKNILKEKIFLIGMIITMIIMQYPGLKALPINNKLKHFKYKYAYNSMKTYEGINKINKFIKEKEGKVIIFSNEAYLYKICNDIPLEYVDLINQGNYGYNGYNKLIKIINDHKNYYYVIPHKVKLGQMDPKVIKYAKKHSKKINSINGYDIYYKK